MEWPFVGRSRERDAFIAALHSGKPGGVLVGRAGVGKTRLATELAASVDTGEPLHIVASASSSSIALGAFAPHLATLGETHDSESTMLARATEELRSLQIPIVIDDAHHLDRVSATLAHHALPRRDTPSLLTVRTGERTPPAITALWKDELLERIDVGPLTKRATARLVRTVLNDRVTDEVVESLWALSNGNLLYLRHLLEGALDDGVLLQIDGEWTLVDALVPPPKLIDLLWDQVLRTETAEALRVLGVMRPFEFDLLQDIVGRKALTAGERHGLIRVERSDQRYLVTVNHPLLAEVSLEKTTEARLREIRSAMAAAIERTGMHREGDVMRVAQLRVEAGSGLTPAVGVTAARIALDRFDPEFADRVLTLARRAHDSHQARLLHARALRFRHRPEEALQLLEEDMAKAENDSEIADAATIGIDTLLFTGQATRAGEFADRILNALTDRIARGRVATEAALVALVTGDVDAAVDIGEPLVEMSGLPEMVRLGVLVTVTIGQPLSGRLRDAHKRIDEGLVLVERDDAPPLAVHQLRMNRQFVFQCEGRMEQAADCGRLHWEDVTSRGGPVAAVGMVTADTLFERAEFNAVVEMYEKVLDAVNRFDVFGNRPNIHLWGATLALHMGREDLADQWEREAADESTDIRWVVRRHRVDAWKAALAGDLDSARRSYEAATQRSEKGGYRMWLLFCLGDAVRLGRPELAIEGLDHLASVMDGETARLFADHARALVDQDGKALDALSRRYRELGWTLRAAESSADAGRAYLISGEEAESRRSALSSTLLSRGFSQLTPPLQTIPDGLTSRELEVAELAVSGLSNQSLADKLYLSLRTVENHLSRVYKKLAVSDRTELADLLGRLT